MCKETHDCFGSLKFATKMLSSLSSLSSSSSPSPFFLFAITVDDVHVQPCVSPSANAVRSLRTMAVDDIDWARDDVELFTDDDLLARRAFGEVDLSESHVRSSARPTPDLQVLCVNVCLYVVCVCVHVVLCSAATAESRVFV